jgi:nickel transport protein
MSRMGSLASVAFLFFLLLLAAPAQAHRLSLTAHLAVDVISGTAEYLPGGPAQGGTIRLRDAAGTVLAETTTDKTGAYTLPAQPGAQIECVTLDGHRAEIPAPISTAAVPSTVSASGEVEAAVARQLQPVLDRLQSLEETTRLRDVLGGIGYIVGFAGLLGWWKSRPRKSA